MKTFKIILVTILLSGNVACASTSSNTDQQQNNYSSYKLCDHVSPSKVSKCVK